MRINRHTPTHPTPRSLHGAKVSCPEPLNGASSPYFAAKKPPGTWLKKLSVMLTLVGSGLMGMGMLRPLPPRQEIGATVQQPLLAPSENVPLATASFVESYQHRLPYTGTLTTRLYGTTQDGHPVTGTLALPWERDLTFHDGANMEVQLHRMVRQMDVDMIQPHWLSTDVPSQYGEAIMEAYQAHVFHHKLSPLLQQRFEQLVKNTSAAVLEESLLETLADFEYRDAPLRQALKEVGFFPKNMGFKDVILHMPIGRTVLTLNKSGSYTYSVYSSFEEYD